MMPKGMGKGGEGVDMGKQGGKAEGGGRREGIIKKGGKTKLQPAYGREEGIHGTRKGIRVVPKREGRREEGGGEKKTDS